MTDRELLELAAKASGMPHPKWNEVHNYMMVGLGGDTKEWNPLEDDSDAFRLAVKLKLSLYTPFWGHANFAEVGIREHDGEVKSICREYNDDSYAATRRAIVRAAAEIGRGNT
jgi:hypothetical protein